MFERLFILIIIMAIIWLYMFERLFILIIILAIIWLYMLERLFVVIIILAIISQLSIRKKNPVQFFTISVFRLPLIF